MFRLFIFWGVFLATIASAADITLYCHGEGNSLDGLNYKTWFNGTIDFESSDPHRASGRFQIEATGTADNLNYDIENRFDDVKFEGTLARDSEGRPLHFFVDGPFLPGGKHVQIQFPVQSQNTQTAFLMERQHGGNVLGQLSCSVNLAGSCTTRYVCHKQCYPMVGCDTICRNETTCSPGVFPPSVD